MNSASSLRGDHAGKEWRKKLNTKKLYETALKADAALKEAKEGLERVSK